MRFPFSGHDGVVLCLKELSVHESRHELVIPPLPIPDDRLAPASGRTNM